MSRRLLLSRGSTASATGPEGEEAFVAATAGPAGVPSSADAGCVVSVAGCVVSAALASVDFDVATVDASSSSSAASAASVDGDRDEESAEEELEDEDEEDDKVSWVTSAASPRVSRWSAASIVARGCGFSSSAS